MRYLWNSSFLDSNSLILKQLAITLYGNWDMDIRYTQMDVAVSFSRATAGLLISQLMEMT